MAGEKFVTEGIGSKPAAVLTDSTLTAQSTVGVTGVHVVPTEFVTQQLETLVADVRLDAIKIGMLANADIIGAVGVAVVSAICGQPDVAGATRTMRARWDGATT